MNFVSTGVKEVTRRLRRQQNRHALSMARRGADRADIELGRHGWGAVSADEAVRPHLDALAKLNADIAAANERVNALDIKLHEQEVLRETTRKDHQLALEQIEAERKPLQRSLEEQQIQVGEQMKRLHEHSAKSRALEEEVTQLTRADERLQSARFPDPKRDERLQTTAARRAAIAGELAQLDAARPDLVKSRDAIEAEISRLRASLLALDQRASQARLAVGPRERAITVAIAGLVKQIAQIRREVSRIEQKKDPSFLHLGRRASTLEQAPPDAEKPFAEARRRRQTYERLLALEAAWLRESRDANRQDLRIFKFVAVTAAVLVAGALLLIVRTPSKRDWLPRKTETIISLNVGRFADGAFSKTLRTQEPGAWDQVWSGMLRKVAQTPGIDVRRQVSRITRALAPSPAGGPPLDYLLVEMRLSTRMDAMLETVAKTTGVWRGLPVPIYQTGDFALAQVGPATLAVGSPEAVKELIAVRLGLQQDLKSDDQFFTGFTGLDEKSAFRLVTQQPATLSDLAGPFLDNELLAKCRAVGMTLDLQEPVSAMFILDLADPAAAGRIAAQLQATPDRILQLQSAGPNLFIEPPSVRAHESQVEWRFKMTQPAAREFLERMSRLGGPEKDAAIARTASQ